MDKPVILGTDELLRIIWGQCQELADRINTNGVKDVMALEGQIVETAMMISGYYFDPEEAKYINIFQESEVVS